MARLAGRRITIIGDSHMEALGELLTDRLRAQGATLTSVLAQRGWSTQQFNRSGQLPNLVQGADLVLVELGGNDEADDAIEYEAQLRGFLAQLGGREVIWVGPAVATRPDVLLRHNVVANLQRRILPRLGVRFIDARGLTRVADLRADQVHFTSAGYERWANELASELRGVSPIAGGLILGSLAVAITVFVLTARGSGLSHVFARTTRRPRRARFRWQ